MKKYFLAFLLFFALIGKSFAEIVDDSIFKELEKNSEKKENLVFDFEMKKFGSCQKADEIINKYLEKQRKREEEFYKKNIFYWISKNEKISLTSLEASWKSLVSNDFSKTNTQISWVDEAEIVKTDGKYIYYFSEKWNYNSREKFINILSLDKKEIIKKIKIPEKILSVQFYLSENKLVILWDIWLQNYFKYSSWNWQSYVIIYDVKNPLEPKLEKLFTIDWHYRNSRLASDKLYIISENNFYNFQEKFSTLKTIPEKIEASLWFSQKYTFSKNKVSDCKNIEFLLPPEKYFEENNFNLTYSVISVLDIKNILKPVSSKIIVSSNVSEIFLNEKNLYITSNIYSNKPLKCIWNSCLFDFYESTSQTLVNKFSLENEKMIYKKSALIDWNPLTQYSMDEDKNWNFRILTQINSWNNVKWNYVNFYTLDKDLKLFSKLEKLGIWENFQSSRYIWDKLFLVTFERVDPLFVIDLKDAKNPKILWELKIPGYSTYLHPYDENHLIWLGYDTKENSWGAVQNSWIKLDLYQINYDKKCGDKNLSKEENEKCEKGDYKWIIAKQLFTKTFAWSGNYSEALHNPRMFMWNSVKNKLFLPIQISDYQNKKIENFYGTLTLEIDKNKWISEKFRITNLDLEKIKKYFEKDCKDKNIYGCESFSDYLQYNTYNFSDSIVNRTLWIWENFYSLSPDKIKANNMDTWKEVLNIDL